MLISTSKWNRERKRHGSKDELQKAIGKMASNPDGGDTDFFGEKKKKKRKKKKSPKDDAGAGS